MAPRVFEYTNNFDTGLSGATSNTTGTEVGLTNVSGSDADNEYVFFSGTNERARLDLNASLTEDERVAAFNVTMQLDINAGTGAFGNRQPDGVSFNLTDQAAFPVSTTSQYELGAPVGLSVRVIPYSWDGNFGNEMQIVWNGQVLAATSLGTGGVNQGPQPFSIGVDKAGNVTASWGPDFSVNAAIPGDQWATADQTNWDFIIAGRTGGNGGTGYIDDIDMGVTVTCFTRGTMIETDMGQRAVEALQSGDLVMTRDRGVQPIRWIGSVRLDAATLQANPKLRPIRIRTGALGEGRPSADLLVSPQHRILVRSKVAQKMFGTNEVLVAAKQLLILDGIDIADDLAEVEYFHFLFDRHEVVLSNGAETESLHTGTQAMKSVGPAAREEILALFPEVREHDHAPTSARELLSGRMARKLVTRHQQKCRPLVM